jgi:hypothetical protein
VLKYVNNSFTDIWTDCGGAGSEFKINMKNKMEIMIVYSAKIDPNYKKNQLIIVSVVSIACLMQIVVPIV